jgi:hypothetical protein
VERCGKGTIGCCSPDDLDTVSHTDELFGLEGPASPPACACSGAGDP